MARFRVTAPSKITAEVVGVSFVRGVAEVDETANRRALAYFSRHAYRVTRIDGDLPPAEAPAAPENDDPPPGTKRPAPSATKAAWVTYAVAQGVTAEEADASTRDQLAERFAEPKEAVQ